MSKLLTTLAAVAFAGSTLTAIAQTTPPAGGHRGAGWADSQGNEFFVERQTGG